MSVSTRIAENSARPVRTHLSAGVGPDDVASKQPRESAVGVRPAARRGAQILQIAQAAELQALGGVVRRNHGGGGDALGLLLRLAVQPAVAHEGAAHVRGQRQVREKLRTAARASGARHSESAQGHQAPHTLVKDLYSALPGAPAYLACSSFLKPYSAAQNVDS